MTKSTLLIHGHYDADLDQLRQRAEAAGYELPDDGLCPACDASLTIAAFAGHITGAAGNGVFFSGGTACYEAIAGLFDRPNSPVASTAVAVDVLREKCKRVPERRAREVHPELFKYLDHD